MKILIIGAGRMGKFFIDLLSFDYEVAVYEPQGEKLRFTYHCQRFSALNEIDSFMPDLVVNCVTLTATTSAFNNVLPHIPQHCILSDIASVKTGLSDYYVSCHHPYVSTHPMFGPTFANLNNLANENAIIITDGDEKGKSFFRNIYSRLNLNIYDYSFDEHDKTMAYSLAIPFVATFAFAAISQPIDAPGTTFKRHIDISRGVLSEDDALLQELLFSPYAANQVEHIQNELARLLDIIKAKDEQGMKEYINNIRYKISLQK